jgi:hypothetical protein
MNSFNKLLIGYWLTGASETWNESGAGTSASAAAAAAASGNGA